MTKSSSNLKLSEVVVGVMRLNEWGFDARGLVGFMESCLEIGASSFDHADIYGGYTCEAKFGEALKLAPHLRQQIQLISKCGIQLVHPNRPNHTIKRYETSSRHIIHSVETSLQNLNTDYLDLLLIHRPDPLMDPAEVAEAFDRLLSSGKVKHFGVSNFSPSQIHLLSTYLKMPLVVNQIECSILHPQPLYDGTLDLALQHQQIPMAWGPLAGGAIFRGESERELRVRQVLTKLASVHQAELDQIALAWLNHHPAGIIPVLGTGKLERIAAAKAAMALKLTKEEWFEILRASNGEDVP